ncbi:hypothetical protein DFH06DRAFT_1395473 [Mycena polygramma]|nr:hypothetical protein DFH06DRAFT_1395473 [Mycena polygramma]
MDKALKDAALAALVQATEADIDDYKLWIRLPSHLAQNPLYSASNALDWISTDKYHQYLVYKRQNTAPDANQRPHIETIDLSASPPPFPPPRPTVDRKPVLQDVINLCSDSDSDVPPATIKQEIKSEPAVPSAPQRAGRFPKGATFVRINRSEKVDRLVDLGGNIPERFPIYEDDVGIILDFSHDERAKKETKTGKPMGLDAFVKLEDQDSYGKGSNGSTIRECPLQPLNNIPARRSSHDCNGAWKCQFFNPATLLGYHRTNATDMTLTKEIFARELLQNQTDSGSAVGRAASFFRVIQGYMKKGCPKSGCPGVPLLKKLKNGPSNEAKLRFVGCTKWVATERWAHHHAAIPADVDEDILASYVNGTAIPPAHLEAHADDGGYCSRLSHPRHAKQTQCLHVHIRDGKTVTAMMVHHPCPVKKIVFTSKDPAVPKCIVIFRGRHSHPPWPMEKPGHAAKEDVKKCLAAGGALGETGGHLNNSRTTQAILGTSLDVKHPAYRDTRRLRDAVSDLKSDGTPAGLLWAGILHDYEADQKLPPAERYVHQIRMEGSMKIGVAMNPELAALIHDPGVRYLEGDITFKRTKGEMNEWEAAIWYTPTHERVTVARLYVNSYTKDAFTQLFDAFFSTVKQVTGKPVRFKAFHPQGNLYSIHFDMEAAQVQGLGAWLCKMVLEDPALRALFPSIDPDKLVQLILKLCSVHFERSTDELVAAVGKEVVNYLNRFHGLSNPNDIENWHEFCKSHENRKLRDWYTHKASYPWLFPGYNESLSSFPPGFWQQSPSHTNLVESAHVASNRATQINLLPVESLRSARAFDARKAASIAAARETCILLNRNNADQARMRRNATRANKRHTYRTDHDDLNVGIQEAQVALAALNENKKVAAANLKTLKAQKKALGRVPRHDGSSGTRSSASSIPRLVGNAVEVSDDDSESGVELVVDPTSLATPSSTFSSPPPTFSALDSDDIDFNYNSDATQLEPGVEFNENWFMPDTSLTGSDPFMYTDDQLLDLLTHFPEAFDAQPGFDFEAPLAASEMDSQAAASSPSAPLDWPALPPIPVSSPVESPVVPDISVPPQTTRKRRREEVDEGDIVTGTRTRTVRVREW